MAELERWMNNELPDGIPSPLHEDGPLRFRPLPDALTEEAAGSEESRDLERLRLIVSEMLHENAGPLVSTMWKIRGVVTGEPPVTSAFACLAVAESVLMNSGLTIPESTYAFIRRFAVELAERVKNP